MPGSRSVTSAAAICITQQHKDLRVITQIRTMQDFKSLTSSDKSIYALLNQVKRNYSALSLPDSELQSMFLLSTWDYLVLQVIETVVGIAVINAAVSKAGPLEDEVFKLDIRYTPGMSACAEQHCMENFSLITCPRIGA